MSRNLSKNVEERYEVSVARRLQLTWIKEAREYNEAWNPPNYTNRGQFNKTRVTRVIYKTAVFSDAKTMATPVNYTCESFI